MRFDEIGVPRMCSQLYFAQASGHEVRTQLCSYTVSLHPQFTCGSAIGKRRAIAARAKDDILKLQTALR
jgi:hypothetical protein